MARVLGVGIATLDIINTVDHYPEEDEELRALTQRKVRGGNVTNTLCVLSQLGHQCTWAGTLANDPDIKTILEDLDNFNINYEKIVPRESGKIPTSYITLNQKTGSRTIVHHRDLDEISTKELEQYAFHEYDWIHFEGRNIDNLLPILTFINKNVDVTISIEIEKPRPDIEKLFSFADVLIFSRHFAREKGAEVASELFSYARTFGARGVCICTWGEEGAWLQENEKTLHLSSERIKTIVDSVGAGDTFNAALIDARLSGRSWQESVRYGNSIAAKKLQQEGFNLSLIHAVKSI